MYRDNINSLFDDTGFIKKLEDLPPFIVPTRMLKYTPILYDFNVTASIINLDKNSRPLEEFDEKIITGSFNKMIEQFSSDFKEYIKDDTNLKLYELLFGSKIDPSVASDPRAASDYAS